jgi:hypothetical protein
VAFAREVLDVMEHLDLSIRVELSQRPKREQGQRRTGFCGMWVKVA